MGPKRNMGPKRRETAKCESETEAEGSEHLVECPGPNSVTSREV